MSKYKSHVNSKYTDCTNRLYASEEAYYQCQEFDKMNQPSSVKQNATVECYPTYGKTSPGVCAPDTTSRCTSGLMNVSNNGWPPCCNENVPDSCIIKEEGGSTSSTPSGASPVPPPLVNSSVYTPPSSVQPPSQENLANAAANCVAKNPNYPVPVGSCVYNPNNPCPTKYETTDSRFGSKMCCAPQTANNANCFSTKSTFGSSSKSNNKMFIIFLVFILLFILMKKK
jgi:hypothetical protein